MGTTALTSAGSVRNYSTMNKLLAVLCLAAAVTAEADPYLLGYRGYAGLGYAGYGGLGYAGYAGHGLGYAGLGYAGLGHAAGYASVSPSASVNIAGVAPAVAADVVAAVDVANRQKV